MEQDEFGDLIGGVLLAAMGLFFALYAQRWHFGTPAQMGPGFFPTVLGALLAAAGLVIVVSAWGAPRRWPHVEWTTALAVLSAMVLFSVLLPLFGLIVASFATVILASIVERETSWPYRLVLAVGVAIVTSLIFKEGLGMDVSLW